MATKFWEVASEFNQGKRRMLEIACPDCGTVYRIRKTRYRQARSCRKCRFTVQNRQSLGKHQGVGDLTKTYYNYFRNIARRRGIPFTVSIEFLWDLAVRQNMRCALSGLPIIFPTTSDLSGNPEVDFNAMQRQRTGAGNRDVASLDRIDSSRGYEEGNVQWVHKAVNTMKNGLPQEEFIALCHRIAGLHANLEPSEPNGPNE